jgi:hypothetical protein
LGYSARYHAVSIAAVFLALAIGILLGVGLGDNVVSGTEESLRSSLENDIDDARAEASDLRGQLEREQDFASRAYPALVGDALRGRRIGLIGIGGLSSDLEGDVEDALDPTGGELVEVSVLEIPPDRGALASAVGRPFAKAGENDTQLETLAERLGTQVVRGRGRLLEQARSVLFSRSSGEGGKLDGIVLNRPALTDSESPEKSATDTFTAGFVRGVTEAGKPTVAVEGTEVPESSVPFFTQFDLATVDDVDLTAGKVAMVFALLGAEGDFGIKDTADSLLPELLVPARRRGSG